MHKSRLAGFVIDCNTDDLKSAAAFWSGALGMDAHALPGEVVEFTHRFDNVGDHEIGNVTIVDNLTTRLEYVPNSATSSVDVEAEARRLELLGAKKIRKVNTWWVMEAPTGHRFCVVRAKAPSFASEAHIWE